MATLRVDVSSDTNGRLASTDIAYVKSRQLPIVNRGLPVRFVEFFFSAVPPLEPRTAWSDRDAISSADWFRADVLVGRCVEQPAPGWLAYQCSTRIIDLTVDPDALFRMCTKNNRYKIERARRRDGIEIDFAVAPTSGRVSEFVRYYDTFAETKRVDRVQRSQFDAMARAQRLVIAAARDGGGEILAARAYFLGDTRARLIYSASLFRLQADSTVRNRIGRANRLLHWEDMLCFRELGVTRYDMGGWYTGTRNDALLRINAFKQEFGGDVIDEWDVFRPGSPRGWVYLRARELAHRVRNLTAGRLESGRWWGPSTRT